MTTGFFQKARRDENGTFVVLMALSLMGLFGMAALSIDIAHVYQQNRDMQSAADFAALAGATLLTNQSIDVNSIIQTAQTIALSNGLTTAEIAAASAYGGAIEVGVWDIAAQTFTPGTTNTNQWNAVRVPAKRSVSLFFGKMTVGPGNGLAAMSPVVHSVAMVTGAGSDFGADLVPYAITPAQATNAYYHIYTWDKHSIGSGNFGKLNLDSIDGNLGWGGASVPWSMGAVAP